MSRETLTHYIHRKTQITSKTHKNTSRHPLSTFSCFKTQNGIPKFFLLYILHFQFVVLMFLVDV